MEACELILRQFSEMGCEGGSGVRIASFEFGKSIQVALGGGVFICSVRRGSKRRSGSVLPRRTRSPIGRPRKLFTLSASVALTQTRVPSCLFGRLESRGHIDGVAISSVIEETTAAEISDNRRPGMDANARDSQWDALLMAAMAEGLRVFV